MESNLNIEKLHKEAKVRLKQTKQNDADRFKTYEAYEKKSDSLAKLYYLNTGNLIDYYVTYKMNPTDSDVVKRYQILQTKISDTLTKESALGDSVTTSIGKANKTLTGGTAEIEPLQKIYESLDAVYRRVGDVDSTSQQMVYDYGTTYSMENIFFWIQVVLVFGFAVYFFGVNSDRGKNLAIFIAALALFYVGLIIITVVRQQFRDYPEGPSSVTTTNSTFQDLEDTVSDACFEKSCCTDSTEWITGQGCVAIDSVPDSSESFMTYKSMSQ